MTRDTQHTPATSASGPSLTTPIATGLRPHGTNHWDGPCVCLECSHDWAWPVTEAWRGRTERDDRRPWHELLTDLTVRLGVIAVEVTIRRGGAR